MKTFREFISESEPIDFDAFKQRKQETEKKAEMKQIADAMKGKQKGGSQTVTVGDHAMAVSPNDLENGCGRILKNGVHVGSYDKGKLTFKEGHQPNDIAHQTILRAAKKHFGH